MFFSGTPPKENYIENQYVEMWIQDGVLFGKYKNIIIDQKAAEAVLLDREKLSKGIKYPLLFDCRNVSYWTKEARDFQNSDRNYALMKAAAVIYSNSYVPNLIINFILKFDKLLIPMKFFHSEEKAYEWILKYAEQK